jgi:capsular polysaccharide biosynthesis protein
VKDPDQAVSWPPRVDDDLPARLSAYEDSADIAERSSDDSGTGLVSLGFIVAALRRSSRLWCILAVVGLILGAGYIVARPPAHAAIVSVLLVDDPTQNPVYEVQTDTALAESVPVAAGVVRQLGLRETPTSFASTYSVTATTNQVLTFSVKGPSTDAAVRIASALAKQFLDYRAQYEETQLQQTTGQLNQQVAQAQQTLDSVKSAISKVSSQPSTPAQQAQLSNLQAQRTAAENAVIQVQQYATATAANAQTVAQSMVDGSQVLNAAMPTKRSVPKTIVIYGIGGLIGGLALGMAIAIIGAVTSDRLRRRDDIAYAFGAPVRLSVGPLRKHRLPDLPRPAAIRRRSRERVVDHLRNAVPGSSKGLVGLAVVAVDDTATVASMLVDLAMSKAKQGTHVILADLSDGARAARLLGVKRPGLNPFDRNGARLLVVVPSRDEAVPIGPLQNHASPEGYAQADEALTTACAKADLVLTLFTLDPASGGEHLTTWATDVVAVVTAGQSTAVRIHAVGEMIRLSGARLGSVVVIGADKSDESLGLTSLSL